MEKSAEVSQDISTTAKQSNHPPKKKGRRGAGSREKAAERYRAHKNETIGMKMVRERIERFKIENAYMPEDYFGTMSTNLPITVPPQPIQITTHKLAEVAEETVKTLVTACKVPTQDLQHDIETVQLASSLQLSAKLRCAQRNTPFQTFSVDEDTLTEQTIRNAEVALLPIAIMLEQVGTFELDDQTFVPVEEIAHDGLLHSFAYTNLESPDLADKDKYSFTGDRCVTPAGETFDMPADVIPIDAVGPSGGNVVFVVNDRAKCIADGLIDPQTNTVHPSVLAPPSTHATYVEYKRVGRKPPPSEVFRRYTEFLTRVQKKVGPDKLPRVNLERGVGTEAQLSFSGCWVGDYRDVYAARRITPAALFFGTAFELNVCEQPLTDESVCLVRTVINSRNAIPRLMQCLTKRVER